MRHGHKAVNIRELGGWLFEVKSVQTSSKEPSTAMSHALLHAFEGYTTIGSRHSDQEQTTDFGYEDSVLGTAT